MFFLITAPFIIGNTATVHTVRLQNYSDERFRGGEISYKILSKDLHFRINNTPFQRVTGSSSSKKGKAVIVTPGVFTNTPITPWEKKKYTEDTRYLQIESKEIQSLIKKINVKKNIISETENLVYKLITDKSSGIPLSPAKDILRNRTGDCTEHTILAVALLRGRGIPARAVVGMVFAPRYMGKKNVFVYHMWGEAHYKGRWHLVDPTVPGKKSHKKYIAFGYHHLKTEMPLAVLKTLGAIRDMEVFLLSKK